MRSAFGMARTSPDSPTSPTTAKRSGYGNCTADVDCLGECGGDAIVDECGICNGNGENCVEGCTDLDATNYNIDAFVDDGSCFYAGENYPFWDDGFDSIFAKLGALYVSLLSFIKKNFFD